MPVENGKKRIVILENLRSLHNVGSIFRTADGAGWDKVYLCGYTGAPPDRRIEKVSLGAEEFVEWEKIENIAELLEILKKDGFKIIALEQTPKSREIFTEDISKIEKLALILGNEVTGVDDETLDKCDLHLEIPMYGQKTSLNVSIAAGIALYILR
jgi:tRNA G18 (ribose-2'-O)-methylase SpoU